MASYAKKDIEIGGQWLSTYRLLKQRMCNLVSVAEATSNVNTIIESIVSVSDSSIRVHSGKSNRKKIVMTRTLHFQTTSAFDSEPPNSREKDIVWNMGANSQFLDLQVRGKQ